MKSVTSYRPASEGGEENCGLNCEYSATTQQFVVHEMKIQIPRAFPVPRNNQQ